MEEPTNTRRPDLTEILTSDLQAFVNDILHQEGGIDHFRELLSAEQLATLENQRKLDLVTRAGVTFTRERKVSNILETTLTVSASANSPTTRSTRARFPTGNCASSPYRTRP